MRSFTKTLALLTALAMAAGLCACSDNSGETKGGGLADSDTAAVAEAAAKAAAEAAEPEKKPILRKR